MPIHRLSLYLDRRVRLSNRESGKNCGERGGGVFVSHGDAEVAEGEDACPHAPQSCRARTPAAPPMEVIFCCFSERDKRVYEMLLQGVN